MGHFTLISGYEFCSLLKTQNSTKLSEVNVKDTFTSHIDKKIFLTFFLTQFSSMNLQSNLSYVTFQGNNVWRKSVFDIYFTEFGAVLTTVLLVLFKYCYKYCYSDSIVMPVLLGFMTVNHPLLFHTQTKVKEQRYCCCFIFDSHITKGFQQWSELIPWDECEVTHSLQHYTEN
jgi:hypothetical protein